MSQVSARCTVTTPTDTEILVVRAFKAPRAVVFDAWTKCEHLQIWMHGFEGWTMPICEMDLRPGGKYRWGWRKEEDGSEMEITGVHKEVDPPARLVTTESWGGDWAESLNTFVFTEQNGTTTVTMTLAYPTKAARDAALETGMTDGMDVSFDRLDTYLQKLA